MKTGMVGMVCMLVAALSWTSWAQAEAPKPRFGKNVAGKGAPGRPSPELMAKLLERFDANKNGRLDPDEMQAARTEFEKMRANGGAARPGAPGAKGAAPGGDKRQELIKRFDKNGDGQLDESERQAAKAAFTNKGNK